MAQSSSPVLSGERILRLNLAGQPIEWLTWQEAVSLYARDLVGWTLGEVVIPGLGTLHFNSYFVIGVALRLIVHGLPAVPRPVNVLLKLLPSRVSPNIEPCTALTPVKVSVPSVAVVMDMPLKLTVASSKSSVKTTVSVPLPPEC